MYLPCFEMFLLVLQQLSSGVTCMYMCLCMFFTYFGIISRKGAGKAADVCGKRLKQQGK